MKGNKLRCCRKMCQYLPHNLCPFDGCLLFIRDTWILNIYMTNQLTEKSDVFSFGVVLLEIVTGKVPIDKGRYIVKEVKDAMDMTKDLYNLHEILDPAVRSGATPRGLEEFVVLALKCVEEGGVNRPKMSEVVKQIENIMEIERLNPYADYASTSATYEGANKGLNHPYTESLFVYSEA